MFGPDGKLRPAIGPLGPDGKQPLVLGPDYAPMFAPCNNVGVIGLLEFTALEKMGSIPQAMPGFGMRKFNHHRQQWE
jgi:hypothetical protein